jgi:hypothetical protein
MKEWKKKKCNRIGGVGEEYQMIKHEEKERGGRKRM